MDDLDRLMDRVLGRETAEICRQELPWLRGCDCPCHQIVRPGLVPCPSCATDLDHSSRKACDG